MTISAFLHSLLAIFAAAKIFGEVAERIGQPAVLGEMIGGIAIGVSGLRLINPEEPTLHLLAQLGVVFLLFLIGLETDVRCLLSVGPASSAVAVVGVILPFFGGYAAGYWLHYPPVVSITLGAALTATSVGITARVLSDLGQIGTDESQIILGAAVLDDIIGLVLLTVVSAMAGGIAPTAAGVAKTFGIAFGFVVLAIVGGSVLAPPLIAFVARLRVAKALFFTSIVFALGLAWLADFAGSSVIIGAFAAGLVLSKTDRGDDIAHEVHDVAQFFIPIFFVCVGAAVDFKAINPFDALTRPFFVMGVVLTVIAVLGKVIAGYAAFGRPLRRIVIGVGMVPRGEVGLIFAQLGLTARLFSTGLYSSLAMMVMITTFVTPPALRALLARSRSARIEDDSTHRDVVARTLRDL